MMIVGVIGWWTSFFALALCRAWLLILLAYSGRLDGLFIGIIEAWALSAGVVNAIVARRREYRLWGLIVPACYLAGLFCWPSAVVPSVPGEWLLWAGFGLSTWALFALGPRCSIAVPSWVSICDVGPYKYIRHPQAAGRLMMICGVVLMVDSPYGILQSAACLSFVFVVVLLEERSIGSEHDYQVYQRSVPWRLVPEVW